jgi:hypothetical protein
MRLYLNIVQGDEIMPDEDGIEVRDIDAAVIDAKEVIQELQTADPGFASRWAETKLVISDESGAIIESIAMGLGLQCFWLLSFTQPSLLDDLPNMLAHPAGLVC